MDIQFHNKRLFVAAMLLACYVIVMMALQMLFDKENAERLSYASAIATLPSHFYKAMNANEFAHIIEILEQIEQGGRLDRLNPNIDALPLDAFLGEDRVDLAAIKSLLRQQRFEAAKAKVELMATKVQRAQRRQARILSYLPWLAIIGTMVLMMMVVIAWFAQRSRLSDEIALASELIIDQGRAPSNHANKKPSGGIPQRTAFNPNSPATAQISFTQRLHEVVKEEVKFTGHRAALVCDGFEHHKLPSYIESELEMIAEQLLRNSVEHGGRPAEQRLMAGKNDFLKIEVCLSESASDYRLSVRDDGEGIDEKSIIARAIELGLVSDVKVAKLVKGQALKLIFLKGFNSPVKPLGVSENDMGLDELRGLIKQQGGTISLQNLTGRFCQFSVRLPKLIA